MNPNTKFVTQILNPLNGEIKRPTTWEYRENHSDNCWRWIIAEKFLERCYEKGVQIELAINFSQHANEKPSECALNYIDSKKKS